MTTTTDPDKAFKADMRRYEWRVRLDELKRHWHARRHRYLSHVAMYFLVMSIVSVLSDKPLNGIYDLLMAIYIKAAAIRYGSR